MNYSEKYKTAQWQQKKCEILVRDNFTCQVCGFSSNDDANSSKLLHVHHRYYIKGKDEVWDYPNEALITLCENCHAKEHSFDGSLIQNAIQNALNSGVLGIEILEALNNMANKMKCHMPKNQSFLIPNKYAASRTTMTKQNTLSVQIKTSKLHKTKKELLDELAIFANQYDANYLQEFIDYWFEYTDEKRCILRCHTDENFFIPTYLVYWKRKREEIKWENEYTKIKSDAEVFANEQYNLYNEKVQSQIDNIIKYNRSVLENEKKTLLDEFESIISHNLLLSTINPKSKSKKTVFEYLSNTMYPMVCIELYRYDGEDEKNSIQYSSRYYKKSCLNDSPRNADERQIKLIEHYLGISLTKIIGGIKRNVNYKIPQQVYTERCKQAYLKRYSRAFLQYREPLLRCPIWKESNISIEDFKLLYIVNQMLRKNAKNIISSIEKIDADISLRDFCKTIGVDTIDENEYTTLKDFLKECINDFDPNTSFTPIQIAVESSCLIRILNKETLPIKMMKKLNEMYNFGFVEYQLNIDERMNDIAINGCTYSTWGIVKDSDLIPPLEILTAMDGCEFDFCAERFYKGTMKSVTIPDDAFKKDLIYYLEKVQELVTKYEKVLIERKLKN